MIKINNKRPDGRSVVYVMSRDQRVRDNHALQYAQSVALKHKVPLYVLFVLKRAKHRSREHYGFMLDGLEELARDLQRHNIPFVLKQGDAKLVITTFSRSVDAAEVVFDFSPLAYPRSLAKQVAKEADCTVTVVDTHNVIPVWVASDKQEFAAHTMRRKVHKHLEAYIQEPYQLIEHPHAGSPVEGMSFNQATEFVKTIPPSGIDIAFTAGEKAARAQLKSFIEQDLADYAIKRNDISDDHQSNLSPYLHFGQLSSLRVALDVVDHVKQLPLLYEQVKLAEAGEVPSELDGMNALFEEMIVRKELSDNFCFYTKSYTTLDGAANWARDTLRQHADDPREFIYDLEEWESAATHDDIWNAAQRQLTRSGKIHGYMRMYWAKKLLEWSSSPEEAVRTAIHLNDTYSIDGGDPNGYVGILWSIAGLHDRPWFERPVYGKIRYMNDSGLRKKFDVDRYVEQWS